MSGLDVFRVRAENFLRSNGGADQELGQGVERDVYCELGGQFPIAAIVEILDSGRFVGNRRLRQNALLGLGTEAFLSMIFAQLPDEDPFESKKAESLMGAHRAVYCKVHCAVQCQVNPAKVRE